MIVLAVVRVGGVVRRAVQRGAVLLLHVVVLLLQVVLVLVLHLAAPQEEHKKTPFLHCRSIEEGRHEPTTHTRNPQYSISDYKKKTR